MLIRTSLSFNPAGDGFAQQLARIAPLPHRLKQAGLQARRVEQIIDRSRETTGGLLQFAAIRLRLLQRRRHGGERRFQFMRDRIEKRLLQFLRLTRDLRLAAFLQRALLVQVEGELRGEGVEQFALLMRRRTRAAAPPAHLRRDRR